MEKRWTLLDQDAVKTDALQQSLQISAAICGILTQRGVEDFDAAKAFFRPDVSGLHNPFEMLGMREAVDRLSAAMSRNERILIFGDYDVDGTTAVACMIQFLRKIYDPSLVDFYIPHRHREGYGVSKTGIDYARDHQYSLVVTVDCGIKSAGLVSYAGAFGIDFIICDHHLPDETLPAAVAILNPKQPGCAYPFKDLCGCGVAFKLITAICIERGLSADHYLKYIDLVAIAIAADIVSMSGENRIIAFLGLQKVNDRPNPGIGALIKLSKLRLPADITSLVFMVAPRINAAGRMDDASKAVNMFIADTVEEATNFAEMLHQDNDDRKEADFSITEEALEMIRRDPVLINRSSTVVFQPHWHKGVVGIVASRLIENYYRPTIVLTQTGDLVSGSARSVKGFNLYEAIHACREFLIGYGGHFAAAGMTLHPGQVNFFSAKFEETVLSTIDAHSLIPEIIIDNTVRFSDLTASFFRILCQMEPFGPDNSRPVFLARNVRDAGYSKLLKEKHIKFHLRQDDTVLTGIGFNLADKFSLLQSEQPVDLIFTLDENEWNGYKTIQLKVIDLRRSESQ